MSTSEGLQHCLPLEVNAAWVPQVFLRIARQGGHAPPQALDLDHASIVYAAPGEQLVPNNPDLLLLEVVRKAFARRRTGIGDEFLQQVIDGKFRNSMLGLIGSHLLLDSAEKDETRMKAVIDNTAALLGDDFPDIIALRLRLAARTSTPPENRVAGRGSTATARRKLGGIDSAIGDGGFKARGQGGDPPVLVSLHDRIHRDLVRLD